MSEPLKIVPRKRRKSVKSRIRARANEQVKLAALEARKAAALEYVGEQLEELIGLLKSEGFKVSRPRDAAPQAIAQPVAPVVEESVRTVRTRRRCDERDENGLALSGSWTVRTRRRYSGSCGPDAGAADVCA